MSTRISKMASQNLLQRRKGRQARSSPISAALPDDNDNDNDSTDNRIGALDSRPTDEQRSVNLVSDSEDDNSAGGGDHNGKSATANDTNSSGNEITQSDSSSLEDGDLPSLRSRTSSFGSSPVGGRVVNGQRTTTRPLSPPSKAGLVTPPSASLANSSNSNNNSNRRFPQRNHRGRIQSAHNKTDTAVDDDMPDDELMMSASTSATKKRIAVKRRFLDDHSKQDDETYESNLSARNPQTNLMDTDGICETTITAFQNICAGSSPTAQTSTPIRKARASLGDPEEDEDIHRESRYRVPAYATSNTTVPLGAEEQTAIEVEYVDPHKLAEEKKEDALASSVPAGFTPQRKNAYLAAMAKKAREEYTKSSASSVASNSHRRQRRIEAATLSPTASVAPNAYSIAGITTLASSSGILSMDEEDVTEHENLYSTFNAAEKRKFLRLINSGLSPIQSTQQVLREREKEQTAPSTATSGVATMSTSANDTSIPHDEITDTSRSTTNTAALPLPKINRDNRATKRGQSSTSSTARAQSQHAALDSVASPLSPGSNQQYLSPNPSMTSPRSAISNMSNGDAQSDFAPSGISYYDAVRKERVHDVDELGGSIGGNIGGDDGKRKKSGIRGLFGRKNKSSSNKNGSTKKQSFARLEEQNSNDADSLQDVLDGNVRTDNGDGVSTARSASDSRTSPKQSSRIVAGDSQSQGIASPRRTPSSASNPVSPLTPATPAADVVNSTVEEADSSDVEDEIADGLELPMLDEPPPPPPAMRGLPVESEEEEQVTERASSVLIRVETVEEDGNDEETDMVLPEPSAAERAAEEFLKRVTREPTRPDATSPVQQQQQSVQLEHEMELDIDTYMSSTDLLGTTGGTTVKSGDQSSVISYRTSGTTMTTTTVSTRARRPGAARSRLARSNISGQDEQDIHSSIDTVSSTPSVTPKKRSGWHETMMAAAACTNRKWDPKRGWIDYVDTEEVVLPGDSPSRSNEKLHLRLDLKSQKQARETERVQQQQQHIEAVVVPFPTNWEKERNDMLGREKPRNASRQESAVMIQTVEVAHSSETIELRPSEQPDKRKASDSAVPDLFAQPQYDPFDPTEFAVPPLSPPSRSYSPSRRSQAKRVPPQRRALEAAERSPSRNRGWVESMKAATANLKTNDGARWDPELGWVGIDVRHELELEDEEDDILVPQIQRRSSESKTESSAAPKSRETDDLADPATNDQTQPKPSLEAAPPRPSIDTKQLREIESPPNEARGSTVQTDVEVILDDKEDMARAVPPIPSSTVAALHSSDSAFNAVPITPSTSTSDKEPAVRLSAPVTGQSYKSTDNTNEEGLSKYLQFGDTGSVRSHYHVEGRDVTHAVKQQRIEGSQPHSEFDDIVASPARLEQVNEHSEWVSPTVDVVKEKVGMEEANLFVKSRGALSALDDNGGSTSNGHKMDNNDHVSNSFDHETDFSWDDDSFLTGAPNQTTSTPKETPMKSQPVRTDRRRPRSRTKMSIKDTSRYAKSFDSSSTSSKSIPLLRGPKRDTSPIRKQPTNHTQPRTQQQQQRGITPSPPAIAEHARPVPQHQAQLIRPTPSRDEDATTHHTASTGHSGSNSVVKLRAQQWELRASNSVDEAEKLEPEIAELAGTAEWKSFLVKKVRKESDVAVNQQQQQQQQKPVRKPKQPQDARHDYMNDVTSHKLRLLHETTQGKNGIHDNDSVFDFATDNPPSVAQPMNHRRQDDNDGDDTTLDDAISDISPIRIRDDYETARSESSTGQPNAGSTFFERLQACAGPILPRGMHSEDSNCNSVPMAHLAFLRTNPAAGNSYGSGEQGGSSSGLCGRPDVILEEDDEDDDEDSGVDTREPSGPHSKDERPGSRSKPRSRSPKKAGSDIGSVISDEMGGKTAYLERIAMKAAVSGTNSKKSKRRSAPSEASTSSSQHSEKWQRFLERKAASGKNVGSSRSSTQDVSKAAEKYTSEKVDQMMDRMRSKSDFNSRMNDQAGAFPNNHGVGVPMSNSSHRRRTDAATAAEDLAAARFDAMMHALSGTNSDGRAEI